MTLRRHFSAFMLGLSLLLSMSLLASVGAAFETIGGGNFSSLPIDPNDVVQTPSNNTQHRFLDQGNCTVPGDVDATAARACPSGAEGSSNMMVAQYPGGSSFPPAKHCMFVDNASTSKSYFVPMQHHAELESFRANLPKDLTIVYGCEATTIDRSDCIGHQSLPEARNGQTKTFTGTGNKVVTYVCVAPNPPADPNNTCGGWVVQSESGECYQDGVCGNANNTYANGAPVDAPPGALCSSGNTGTVSWVDTTQYVDGATLANGYFTWICSGRGDHSAANWSCGNADPNGSPTLLGCSATCQSFKPPVNAVCGASNLSADFTSAPTYGLCNQGNPTNVHGNNSWNWSCAGQYGGNTVTCQTLVDQPVCGAANGQAYYGAPWNYPLCSKGNAGDGAYNADHTYSWSCGIGDVKNWCYSFEEMNGACGASNGLANQSTPPYLCNSGDASAVSFDGNAYYWSCNGRFGGNSQSCSSPFANSAPLCGASNGAWGYPTDLCLNHGYYSNLTANGGGWSWYCYAGSGGSLRYQYCSTQGADSTGSGGSGGGDGGDGGATGDGGAGGCGCGGVDGSSTGCSADGSDGSDGSDGGGGEDGGGGGGSDGSDGGGGEDGGGGGGDGGGGGGSDGGGGGGDGGGGD